MFQIELFVSVELLPFFEGKVLAARGRSCFKPAHAVRRIVDLSMVEIAEVKETRIGRALPCLAKLSELLLPSIDSPFFVESLLTERNFQSFNNFICGNECTRINEMFRDQTSVI